MILLMVGMMDNFLIIDLYKIVYRLFIGDENLWLYFNLFFCEKNFIFFYFKGKLYDIDGCV